MSGGAVTSEMPIPRQLPPAPAMFVNRTHELKSIDSSLSERAQEGTTPLIVLRGGHGVGKSATGLRWAHLRADRFEDGQLYAHLGTHRHQSAVEIGDVAGAFLAALGLPNEVIPVSLAERTALLRSRLASRQLLIVLDDVQDAGHVLPLVPNSTGCAVVVTTRHRLEELEYAGARTVHLRPFDDESARALMSRLIGAERVEAERPDIDRLTRLCDGLPVALRICGARLADPDRPARWLVARLADESKRLERLSPVVGRSLRAVFDDAYGTLAAADARLYRRLGLHPGRTFGLEAAAEADPTVDVVDGIARLAAAHLLDEARGRLRFHDLLRIHACDRARIDEDPREQEGVVDRFVAFYVRMAQHMDRAVVAERLRYAPRWSFPADAEVPRWTTADALGWFERERANLVAAMRAAFEQEWDEAVWALGEALWIAFQFHKHPEEAKTVYTLAADAATREGNRRAEGRMRQQLGRAFMDLDQLDEADAALSSAHALAEATEDERLRASIIEFRGLLLLRRDDDAAALTQFEEARAIGVAQGNRRGVALQDYFIGRALRSGGRFEEARRSLVRALEGLDETGDPLTVARVLLHLGEAARESGHLDEAEARLRSAVALTMGNDAPWYAAHALEALGRVLTHRDATAEARRCFEQSIEILTTVGSPLVERVEARLAALPDGG